jgi:hypothetical protein
MAKGDGVADCSGRGVDSLIQLLGPKVHPRAGRRVPGTQAQLGIRVFEVFVDDGGFDDDVAVIDERGYDRVGIEFDVCRGLLIACAEIEAMACPWQGFFAECKAHLLCTNRHVVGVELDHGIHPPEPGV